MKVSSGWMPIAAAGALLAAGLLAARPAPPPVASSPGKVQPPLELLAASGEERSQWLARAVRYVRWTLDHASEDLDALCAAREVLRRALALCELPSAAGPETVMAVKRLGLEVEGRFQRGLSEAWFSCRKSLALREWAKARSALKSIQRAANDPKSADHRRARLYLEKIAAH